MSRPTPEGEARPRPLRPNPRGPRERATVLVAAAGARKGRESERAPPSARRFPLRSGETRSVQDPSRPEVRPSEEGRGILSFFRIHGRDLTSASDGVGTIPPHSLAFRPEWNPLDRHRASRRADPLGSPEESFGRDRDRYRRQWGRPGGAGLRAVSGCRRSETPRESPPAKR